MEIPKETKPELPTKKQDPKAEGPAEEEEDDFIIDPNTFVNKGKGEIDYDKLIKRFGCHKIDESLLARMEKLTGVVPHRFLRRGIFFTHR